MQVSTNRATLIAAGAIVAAGAAWAGSVALAPPPDHGPSEEQVRAIAADTRASLPESAPLDSGAVPAPVVTTTPAPVTPLSIPSAPSYVRAPSYSGAPLPPAQPAPVRVAPGPAVGNTGPARIGLRTVEPAFPRAAEDPVKNLALVGVTQEGTTDRAWLYDLATRSRENVAVGERAFGFVVRKIDPESVRLARAGREFVLHLGEKPIPVVTAAVDNTSTGNVDPAGAVDRNGMNGSGRRFGQQQDGNDTGDARADYIRRMRQARTQNEQDGDDNNRRNNGGRDDNPIADNSRNRGDDRNPDNNDPRIQGNAGDGRGGRYYPVPVDANGNPYPYGYAPYAFGGNGYGPNGYGGGNGAPIGQASTGRTGISNPQTARRRGTTLNGSSTMPVIEGPAPIANPQTARRMGTNTGPTFGEGTNNNSNRRTGVNPANPGSRSGPSR